jgi:hypothetical protein
VGKSWGVEKEGNEVRDMKEEVKRKAIKTN